MNETTQEIATLRFLNETAVYNHALECSRRNRAGRFTRVGSEFLDDIKVGVEALEREIRNKYSVQVCPIVDIADNNFVTGALLEKIRDDLNHAIGRLIQAGVQRQPSCGKTLGRTR